MEHQFSAPEAALAVEEITIYLTHNISDVPNAMELLPLLDMQKTMRFWDECDLIAEVAATDEFTIFPTYHDDFMMITTSIVFNVSDYTAALTDTARFEWFVVSNATAGVPFFVSMWSMQGAGGAVVNFTTPFCDGTLLPTECANCQSASASQSQSYSYSPSASMSSSRSLTQSASQTTSRSNSQSTSIVPSYSVSPVFSFMFFFSIYPPSPLPLSIPIYSYLFLSILVLFLDSRIP